VKGHILAMEKGMAGERYILGGENVDYLQFFRSLAELSGKKQKMFRLPLFIMMLAAHSMLFLAKLTGSSPMIIPALVRKFSQNFPLRIEKARKELQYDPLPLREGMLKTLDWIKTKDYE
jgi:nucleoside-diphosphate-sugar epimerase